MPTFIDVSHEVVSGMTTYPGLPVPEIDHHLTFDESRDHYAAGTEFAITQITMIANTGTYLDTPAHRYRDGADLADLELAQVAGLDGIVVPGPGRSGEANGDGRGVDAVDLHGLDVAGKAVLVRTDWDRNWRTERYGDPDHPYLTEAGAHALVEAGAALVGIDSINIDDTSPEGGGARPAHSVLLAAGIPVVEHLCRLDQLPDQGFTFFAVPVKIRGMGTFPVRTFAMLD